MKKTISLVLALVMCLSLCACASGENTQVKQDEQTNTVMATETANGINLCQEWRSVSTGDVATFDENGYFHINGNSYEYKLSEDGDSVIVNVGVEVSLPISVVDDIYRIDIEGVEYVPASDYEALHTEYAENNLISAGPSGDPCLNAALAGTIIESVELTTENWSNYLTVYNYSFEVVAKDAFGEIVTSETVPATCLGYGTDRYHAIDATIELKHKETGELVTFQFIGNPFSVDTNFNPNDYECTRIQGHIYFFDIPEELIVKVDREGTYISNSYFMIGDSSFSTTWYLDIEAKVVKVRTSNVDDYLE